ncbi:hypothetical protein M404DRAFT_1004236, partial [Pisolithus tinctorius Marx 270]
MGAIVGNVVVVIDALDESGTEMSRRRILSLLTSTEAARLPANFRILLTSRPLPDIEYVLGHSRHVLKTCLDDVPLESAERDIRLFVTNEIGHLKDIGSTEIDQIAEKANGLFEWARLACEFVRPSRAGHTVKERFDDVVTLHSGEGNTLLDATYISILESGIPTSPVPLSRFHSVMRQVLMVMEPLPMKTLSLMRMHFPSEEDRYDISVILEFMAPVLSGIIDHSTPVCPLHASFYDFLTDRSRSGIYFIDLSDSYEQSFASLQILCGELKFNICGLESSYFSNAEVADLQERKAQNILPHLSYSCQFWAQHLWRTAFDFRLATLVNTVVGSERFLFWLEAMSLLGLVGSAADALTCTAKWLL